MCGRRGRGAAAYSTGIWGDEDDGEDGGSGSAYATPGPEGGDEEGEEGGDMYATGGRGGKRKVRVRV
jgi:hypothetical protein